MGSLNPLATPKTPAPVVVAPPTTDTKDLAAQAEAERKRRAAASGRTSTIRSSLADAIPDAGASTYKSTLLGG
jgi:hypothetical protein